MLDNVTINQLRTFVAVCDAGSFSGAAKTLRRAQSAVSHAIGSLELALDVELFVRDARKAELSPAGRDLLPDARAVIARTEEMKTRARSVVEDGVPQFSIAVDVYFPRRHLIACLQTLHRTMPTAVVSLRMTTMQGGEALVFDGNCSLSITVADVPELKPSAIERHWLCETEMVTVCAPSHPLARSPSPVARDEFSRHVQLVVTDNRPQTEKVQMAVAGERQWLVNDLGAKHDFLRGGLGWGHMPTDLVADDLRTGILVELRRRAWHLRPLTFVISSRRGHDRTKCEARFIELLSAGPTVDAPKRRSRTR
jgi:DNA-binding transcriptional LysR family regulator